MLAKVITENGQKKIIPLTADAGAGNPVGTVIVVCSNQIPSNYLPLGTQYDTSLYPVLYALLGTDTTPTASALGLPTLTSGQYVIKATSGLSENAQDNVINTLNEQRSYSTEEHPTGKKWIDGKDIYQVTFQTSVQAGTQTQIGTIADISEMIHTYGNIKQTGGSNVPIPYYMSTTDYAVAFCVISNGIAYATSSASGVATVTFEYTKTTD